MSYQILGLGYVWWSGDPLSLLPPLPGFRVTPTDDATLIAHLAQIDPGELLERMRQANQAYVAYLHTEPIAYGWSASGSGAIYELGLEFPIPAGNRYLWDFVTLPPWRGRGVYPRFLQAIMAYERAMAHRFWIGHTSDNHPSRRGILKAGFQTVEALVMTSAGALKIVALGASQRATFSPMGLKLGVLADPEGPL